MVIAGKVISVVLAVSDTPTARASILVAIPRIISDLRANIFFCMVSVSLFFHHSYIILHPIYPRSKNAIQWLYSKIECGSRDAIKNHTIGITP